MLPENIFSEKLSWRQCLSGRRRVSRNLPCRDSGERAFQAKGTACGKAFGGKSAGCSGGREQSVSVVGQLPRRDKEFGLYSKNGVEQMENRKQRCDCFAFEKNPLAALETLDNTRA